MRRYWGSGAIGIVPVEMKLSAGWPFGSILGVRGPFSCPAQLGQWDKDQDRQVDPGLALVPVP